jgi:BASS family bile acid:Na+ symporter
MWHLHSIFHAPTSLLDRPIRFTPPLATAMSVAVAAASSSSRYPLSHANSHHPRRVLSPVRFIFSPPQPYASPSALLWHRPRQAKSPTTFCSAPSLGRVGWPRREGSAWLLSFRAETDASSSAEEGDGDSSQAVSALLPVIVVATAVAALGNPSTFSW